jgi:uncharacterized protein (DUF1697 family)
MIHRYIAFLRGINLGKRRIKMDRLRDLFVEMKFAGVQTFIASGNVMFESSGSDVAKIETRIARQLHESLGCEVDVFVRTRAELAAVVATKSFATADLENEANTVHVSFLREPPGPTTSRALASIRTKDDEFCVVGRELYWLCRIRTSDSEVWTLPQMKALKLPSSTMRNITTLRKIAALYPAE